MLCVLDSLLRMNCTSRHRQLSAMNLTLHQTLLNPQMLGRHSRHAKVMASFDIRHLPVRLRFDLRVPQCQLPESHRRSLTTQFLRHQTWGDVGWLARRGVSACMAESSPWEFRWRRGQTVLLEVCGSCSYSVYRPIWDASVRIWTRSLSNSALHRFDG